MPQSQKGQQKVISLMKTKALCLYISSYKSMSVVYTVYIKLPLTFPKYIIFVLIVHTKIVLYSHVSFLLRSLLEFTIVHFSFLEPHIGRWYSR